MSTRNEIVVATKPAKRQAAAPEPVTAQYHISVGDVEVMAKHAAASRLFGMDESQAFTLMMLAQAKGIHPIQALERYHVIQNRPAMKADAMFADFQAAGGTVRWVERTNTAWEGIFTHPVQAPNGESIRFTIEDAKRAGLLDNKMWTKYPSNMLKARVISNGIRLILPGIVAGIYTPEEAVDFDDGPRRPEFTNDTAYGGGKYAEPTVVKAYQAWLTKFVEDANLKWYDHWTLKHGGELPDGVADLTNRWILSNHLCKWARESGLIEAPEDFKSGQTDRLVAILFDRDRAALEAEARAYCVNVSRELKAKLTASLPPVGPAANDAGDASDVPGADEAPDDEIPDAETDWPAERE
jgi:hypothetical protein